jgi:uncharacterized protein (DUF305 family)
MPLRRRHVLALVTVLAAVSLAGVALAGAGKEHGPDRTAQAADPGFPVLLPGRPGESATVVLPDEIGPRDAAFNTNDADFLRMMIPHHQQAIEMAELAETRAKSPQLKAFAERIRVAQAGEIAQFKAWLAARGLDPETPGHDHGDMPGMQSPEAMRSLAAAHGETFDRLFVAMMTDHHQGAIEMARTVLTLGINPWVEEMATSIAHEQAVEIDRMRAIAVG